MTTALTLGDFSKPHARPNVFPAQCDAVNRHAKGSFRPSSSSYNNTPPSRVYNVKIHYVLCLALIELSFAPEVELAQRHWYAIATVLLVAGAAGVAVPLALRVSAGASMDERLELAAALLASSPLVDGHNDLPWNIRKFLHNKLKDFRYVRFVYFLCFDIDIYDFQV